MIHLSGPFVLVAVLAGLGVYGVLARRNAVMVLVAAELLVNSAALLLITVDAATADPLLSGQVLALFVITVAAAEIGLALAVVLLLFRHSGSSDLDDATSLGETSTVADARAAEPAAGWTIPAEASANEAGSPATTPADETSAAGPRSRR